MSQISDSDLQEIEAMAGLLVGPEEIALCMGIPKDEFIQAVGDQDNPISKAFYRGSMATEFKLRKNVFKLANQGSSPAQSLAMKMNDEFNLKKVKYNL